MESLVKIILLDDHPLVMEGLKNRLEEEPNFSVQAAFTDPLVLLEQIHLYDPDVVVMDVSMPKLDGFELASILKGKYGSSLKLIMLSGYGYDEFYRKAYELGVNAYLSKQATYPQIINAIRQSISGHVLMPERLFNKSPVEPLTPAEQRVLALVARELTNKDIARELAVSQRTVEYHITSIIQKLEVKTRIGAVAKGYELGILGPMQM